ncbi:MAG: transglycosylase domain-containing protein [Rickettsiales bacterium]
MLFFGKKKKRKARKKKSVKRGEPKLSSTASRERTSVKKPVRNKLYVGGRAPKGMKARKERSALRRRLIGASFSVMMLLIVVGGIGLILIARDLPDISSLDVVKKQRGVTVEAQDGKILATYGDIYGNYVSYEQMPKHLIQAVIATEDRRYFAHNGIDVWGIARATVKNIMAGRVVEGGSTITQQVAKNVFLTPERSLKRKLQEAILAFWLEGRFTKQEILSIYLNRVYLGAGTFGIDAASLRYFGKPATHMNMMESAMIAGLLKAPSRFAPTASMQRAKNRAAQVLLNMVDAGMITPQKAQTVIRDYDAGTMKAVEGGHVRYFTDWIVDQLPEYIGNVESDLVVTVTMDPTLQAYANDAVENVVAMEGEGKNVTQGAMIAMTPDGAVKAMIGGLNYGKSQYNRAAQAKRQPGSSFKLFVYLAALEAGMTPMSEVEDAPITLQVGNKTWTPGNYTGDYKGLIPATQAFRESLNTVSVRLAQYAGIWRVAQMAQRLGIANIPANPSISLGASEVTLLDMVGAYGHLANEGFKVKPYGIERIRTTKGEELFKHEPTEREPVLARGTVEMMNYMLLDVVRAGTGARANIGRPAAGKTGTSQGYKDAWFIGFTPQLVAGAWVGNDSNQPMAKITGGSIPAMMWHDFMVRAMEGVPVRAIPNSSSNSEGLLPWLFGGSETTPEEPVVDGEVPENTPFKRQGEEWGEQGEATDNAPAQELSIERFPPVIDAPVKDMPEEAVEAAQPKGARDDNEVLDSGFWKKLGVKEGKVEYTYPDSGNRRH